jgi:hypothetical protein
VVVYDGVIVGEYTADLIVEDQVIVELKVVPALSDVHVPQCRNYLRVTGKTLCLLINFGRPKVEIRRVTSQARSPEPFPSSPLIPFIRLKLKKRSYYRRPPLRRRSQAGRAGTKKQK